mgnify:CR=1 FL=1
MNAKPTRDALGDEILKLGLEHDDIYVIDCDVAKSCKTLEFAEKLPKQHVNVGISEQNAVGMAAGIATTGKVPFVVTYAIFGSMRACEQIRQEVCYTKLNVKILCSHGGLTPANDGASHQCIEDMGVLRTIPNMTVIMPADYQSARKLIEKAYRESEELVEYIAPTGSMKSNKNIEVNINGVQYTVPRGIKTNIPRKVAEIIDNSIKQAEFAQGVQDKAAEIAQQAIAEGRI